MHGDHEVWVSIIKDASCVFYNSWNNPFKSCGSPIYIIFINTPFWRALDGIRWRAFLSKITLCSDMKKSPTCLLMKLQKCLCLVTTVFEKGGVFIVPYLLWHGTLNLLWSQYVVAFYDMRGGGGVVTSGLFRWYWGPILTRIPRDWGIKEN